MIRNFSAFLVTVILIKQARCLCNGDFEAYALWPGCDYASVSSNYSCWYERSGGEFEVQRNPYLDITKVAELAFYNPNVLCQNATALAVGNAYRLNFTVYNHFNMQFSEIRVLVNGQFAFNHTTQGQNSLSNASYILTAQSTNTQLCFDYSLSPSWTRTSVGPCLDNVTLEAYFPIFDPTNRSGILCNGDFQEYDIPLTGPEYLGVLPNYSCWYDRDGGVLEIQRRFNLNTTNVAELAFYYPYILCQNVSLIIGDSYQLNFTVFNQQHMAISEIRVLINNESVFNHTTLNEYNRSNASFIFISSSTNTQICFDYFLNMTWVQTGSGPCLDNITLQSLSLKEQKSKQDLNKFELNQGTIRSISAVLSFPVKMVPAIKIAYLLIEDLWLYYYSNKNFTGTIEAIFRTIGTVQSVKFELLQKFLGWGQYKNKLVISNYVPYDHQKFVQIQGTSSVLIDSNFAYFIYSVPQNVVFSLALFLLFCLLRNYETSKYIRKFYFIKTVLAVTLIQENLGYFIFVCFLHIKMAFTFNIADKISLIFTVIFLFSLFLFTFCFYFLISSYLGKRASYFAEYTYRQNAGFCYKIVNFVLRNLLRAVVFCFFHYQYRSQLLMLSLVQIFTLVFTIVLESLHKTVLSKAFYSLNLLYCLIFALLNLILLFQDLKNEEAQIVEIIKQMEEVVIYCLIGNRLLIVPQLAWKRRLLTIEQFQQQLHGQFREGLKNQQEKLKKKTKKLKKNTKEKKDIEIENRTGFLTVGKKIKFDSCATPGKKKIQIRGIVVIRKKKVKTQRKLNRSKSKNSKNKNLLIINQTQK